MNTERPYHHKLTQEQVDQGKEELKKVFQLASDGVYVEMFSEAVDSVWHELLLDPKEYERFSTEACGKIVGHGKNSGQGLVGFVQAYENRFGKLADIWFHDARGNFDQSRYSEYLDTGNLVSAWVCNPTHNCRVVAQ